MFFAKISQNDQLKGHFIIEKTWTFRVFKEEIPWKIREEARFSWSYKRAYSNKSEQGGILVKNKFSEHARLLETAEYVILSSLANLYKGKQTNSTLRWSIENSCLFVDDLFSAVRSRIQTPT